MIEFLQIILSFFLFFLIITVPINIFNPKLFINKNFSSLEIASFNLILNCNILLFLSILPIALSSYNLFFIFLYLFIFIYIYFIQNFKFDLYKKFIQFLSIFFIIYLIISTNVAGELVLGWDAKYFYYINALFFVENQNLYDLDKFAYGTWQPHLGTYIWAFFWNLMPIKLEYFGRLFYVFILCFSIFYVCHNNLRDKFVSNIIFILIILFFYKYESFSGLQEILIFSFLAILSKYFSLLKDSKNIYQVFFIVLGCNLLIWFKAEGIVYSSILVLLLNFSNQILRKIKIYINISYASIIIFKIVIYHYFLDATLIDIKGQPYYLGYILNLNFEFIIHKLKFIIPYLFYYVLTNVFFISGIIILCLLNFQKKNSSYIKLVNFYFILNLIFIFSAYIFRDQEIEHSVRTTMERIIFTSSGFYVFLTINFFKNINNNLKNNYYMIFK